MGKVNNTSANNPANWLTVAKKVQTDSKDWAGTLDNNGKAKQVLVVKIGDKFGAVQDNGSIEALEGATDMDSAKTLARATIKAGKFPGAISFKREIADAMEAATSGTTGKPASEGETPVDPNAGKTATGNTPTSQNDPVAKQAEMKKVWAAVQQKFPQNLVDIKDKNGKDAKILIASKDGGKTYVAVDSNLKEIPMATVTSKDPKKIYEDNKALIDSEVKNGFGQEATEVSGPVNQNTANETSSTAQTKPTAEQKALLATGVKNAVNSNQPSVMEIKLKDGTKTKIIVSPFQGKNYAADQLGNLVELKEATSPTTLAKSQTDIATLNQAIDNGFGTDKFGAVETGSNTPVNGENNVPANQNSPSTPVPATKQNSDVANSPADSENTTV